MKADNIVVLKKGKVVQQGTHSELLADQKGEYWGLANAQHLSLGEEEKRDMDWINFDSDSDEKRKTLVLENFNIEPEVEKMYEEPEYEKRGFFGSFGLLLWEQKPHWPWYILMLLASFGAGGE